jgi:trehalose 6-phosphate synthase/phosphatase
MVHEIVGRINGQFGTLTYVPIYHLDTSLSFTELCALYAVTDVALVSSLVRRSWGGGEEFLR